MVHEMELLGKTKVKVKDEQVVETGEPLIEWCPLFDKVRGIKRVTSEAASGNMAFRIKQHGMFSAGGSWRWIPSWALGPLSR